MREIIIDVPSGAFSPDWFLNAVIVGNTLASWLIALAVFAGVFLALKILRGILEGKLKKLADRTGLKIYEIALKAARLVRWPFYAYAGLYAALKFVSVPSAVEQLSYYIFLAGIAYYTIRFLEIFVDYGAEKIIERSEDGKRMNEGIINILASVMKIVLWIGALVMVLANLGFNVTSVIAGLGIGGVAIALAIQNILGDLFNSLAIYLDKPFKIGDFVIVGDYMGIVKKVGIKTTRIQALQGEEIVFSNSDLMGARIQNFGVMEKRRIIFSLGLTYGTPAEKLRRVPNLVKDIINRQENVTMDRAHFKEFGPSSLNFEFVYYVLSGDYGKFMDTQQAINLAIIEAFAVEGIEFAFPTQTVHVKKD